MDFNSHALYYALPFSELDAKVAKPKLHQCSRAKYNIGEHIKKKRALLGMSETDVASLFGVKPQTIVVWENGTTIPQLRRTTKLIEFLGYDPYMASITK